MDTVVRPRAKEASPITAAAAVPGPVAADGTVREPATAGPKAALAKAVKAVRHNTKVMAVTGVAEQLSTVAVAVAVTPGEAVEPTASVAVAAVHSAPGC